MDQFAYTVEDLRARLATAEADLAAVRAERDWYCAELAKKMSALEAAEERAAALEAERASITLAQQAINAQAERAEERVAALEAALTHIADAPYGWQWAIAVARAALGREETSSDVFTTR